MTPSFKSSRRLTLGTPQDNTTSSDTSSHSATPEFTPSVTPPQEKQLSLGNLEDITTMDEIKEKDSETKSDTLPVVAEGKIDEGTTNVAESTKKVKCKKLGCKSHATSKKPSKSKKKAPSSDSSSSSSSSSSDSESDQSESSSDEDRKKSKKKKKNRKRNAKSSKKNDTSEEETESSDETSTDEDKKKRKKRKKSKKTRKAASDTEDENEKDDDPVARAQAQLDALALRRRGYLGHGGNVRIGQRQVLDEVKKTSGSKTKTTEKKTKDSKPAYFRVDQLWDTSRHNWNLTQTSEKQGEDEYGKYIFHVRRKFDWEGKYDSTVVDIKSKTLKEALKSVMGECKAVSLEEKTPAIDPNMLFMYLEEIRAHMNELKVKSKSEDKKKAKKLKVQASHVKVLVKFLDKDYSETKKTLYPLLEANLITFDLLWFLYKSNEIAYCPTYSNLDEPRAFKIEYATKESSFVRGTWYNIEGKYFEYDGKTHGRGSLEVEVESFKGPKPITSLACYPLKYHKEPEQLREQLIQRGRKFLALKGMNYRFHKGMAFYKKKRQVIKVNINGRIMIDPAGHRRYGQVHSLMVLVKGYWH